MTNRNTHGKDPLEYVRRAIPWALGYLAGNKVDFLYRGPDTPYFTTTCDQPAEMLTVDHLEYDGKSPLDVLLTIAFRLGVEFKSERDPHLFYCMECDELARWRVWYTGCVLPVGSGNIAYNSFCDEHAMSEMKNGRDGWPVAAVRRIEGNESVRCPRCDSINYSKTACSNETNDIKIVLTCRDCGEKFEAMK